LEGEQEGEGKVEEKGSKRRKAGTTTKPATTFGVAEEAAIASAGDNRACSNRRGRKNEYSGCEGTGAGCRGSSKTGSLCYGHRLWEELLCLRGIWAHSLILQELESKRQGGRQ